MVGKAKRMALRHQLAKGGDRIVLMAGVPFGTAGSTNVIHVVRLIGDELERYRRRKLSAAVSAGISPAISRARKPIGPIFFARRAPASPCSQTPHSKAVSGSAPRASRPPTIPARTSPLPETPRPGRAAFIDPGLRRRA